MRICIFGAGAVGSHFAVRLKLAVPQKGRVRVTVRPGLVAADGMSSFSDFTAVVT